MRYAVLCEAMLQHISPLSRGAAPPFIVDTGICVRSVVYFFKDVLIKVCLVHLYATIR